MDKAKQDRLEAAGWEFGSPAEFLGLSEGEWATIVERTATRSHGQASDPGPGKRRRGRIPRRWVFLGEDDKVLFHLKVPRTLIVRLEALAARFGLSFEETVRRVLETGAKKTLSEIHEDGSTRGVR